MNERTLLVLHPASQSGVREALEALPGISLVCPVRADDVVDALQDAPVLVTARTAWRDAYLSPALRWVQSESAGYEGFPLDEFRRRGVVLTTARGLHVVCAEHAIGLLLVLTRDIHQAIRDMSARRWDPRVAEELGGRTIVVAGLGSIGEAIARRLSGWDVRLIGITRTPSAYTGVLRDVRPIEALGAACGEASVLVIALPSASNTRHLVSASVLDALGKGIVINVSRGSLIDEEALVERLRDGRLLAAGLDVFEAEPLPAASPLWALPNVVCTPHMAGHSPRYPSRLAELIAHNLRAYTGSGAWLNRIC